MAELKKAQNRTANLSGSVPLSDIFFMTLRHWPWILLSVFICVGAAYVYLLRTPNVYSRSADILIKNDRKGQSSTGADDFSKLGLFQSNANILNEITNLQAKDLTEEVVRRLGLDISYYHSGTFHDVVAYGYALPLKIEISGYPEEKSYSMNLDVSKGGKVTINELKGPDGVTIKQTFTGKFNDSILTPLGYLIASPTKNYRAGEAVSLIINKLPLRIATDSYNSRLSVTMSNEKSTVLTLTFADQSPQRADDFLNSLIEVYNENWIRDKNLIAVSTSNFINERLSVIEGELGNVDSDISSYKSANLVPDVGAAASMYMSQSQQTQAKIFEVNNQLSMARYIRSYLTSDDSKHQLLPVNTGIQSSNILSLINEYNDRVLQRNNLVSKSSESNPIVVQYDDQLKAQREAIVRTIDNEITALNAQLRSLHGSEAETMSRIASNPTQAKNLLTTERQQKVKESLYLFLLQKREENELSQAFTAYNTRIVNRPGPSGIPPTPNRRNILSMAFLIGLVIPFGVTFVKETNNTKVRGRKDVEHLAVPFLGEIPQYTNGSHKSKTENDEDAHTIVVKAGKRNIINEAFRVLRTNVEFMCSSSGGENVLAITSFNPGSGKSFISVNLGMAIALKGKRVLVIDGDMRHGSASSYIGSPDEGLSNYLTGAEDNINKVIVKDQVCETLFFLPIGAIPPNPTELLESKRFGELIVDMRPHYDYILIDCPPIEVVADAQIIDKQADRTFFILRSGLLERSILPDLDRLYEEKKYKNMAFILNGTRNEQSRYGYSHSYRYGYGYGYGYGYNYGEGKKKNKRES